MDIIEIEKETREIVQCSIDYDVDGPVCMSTEDALDMVLETNKIKVREETYHMIVETVNKQLYGV